MAATYQTYGPADEGLPSDFFMTPDEVTTLGSSVNDDAYELPVFGLGTYIFPTIHITAIATLAVSTLVSLIVLIFIFRTIERSFWNCSVGERLVVYLSICDLGFSISHGSDHVVMIILENHTPQPACTIISFFVSTFTLGQSLVVNMAAISAVIFIVRERKVSFGTYDWKLIMFAFVLPAVLGAIFGGGGWMGPIGAWCFMDITTTVGKGLNTFYILAMIFVFFINTICYVIVFVKIQQVTNLMKKFKDTPTQESTGHTRRSAQNMALIVLAYLFQWSLYVAFTLWQFFGNPHVGLLIADVVVCNLGGVFNALAYTLIRRASANAGKQSGSKSHASSTDVGSTTSVTEKW